MAEETLHPAARRHLEGRFLAGPHPTDCHTYHFESEPREEDPEGDGTAAFYFEREEVRTHALLSIDAFVRLLERSLSLIPSEAGAPGAAGAAGAADYRREVGELFGFINLAVKDGGAPAPGGTADSEEAPEEG